MNRDIKISGVVAWPSDKDRAGLIENFGLVLRELVQRIGRDTEYELGTVWISERQNFEQPVDVFVNLVNVREHLELVRLLIGAKWRAREIKASLSKCRQEVAGVRLESCEVNCDNLHGREDRAESESRAAGEGGKGTECLLGRMRSEVQGRRERKESGSNVG